MSNVSTQSTQFHKAFGLNRASDCAKALLEAHINKDKYDMKIEGIHDLVYYPDSKIVTGNRKGLLCAHLTNTTNVREKVINLHESSDLVEKYSNKYNLVEEVVDKLGINDNYGDRVWILHSLIFARVFGMDQWYTGSEETWDHEAKVDYRELCTCIDFFLICGPDYRGFVNTFLKFYDVPRHSEVGQKLNRMMTTGRFGKPKLKRIIETLGEVE